MLKISFTFRPLSKFKMGLMDENFSIQDSVRVLNSSFIKTHVPMIRAIGLMEIAFRILSEESAYIPNRTVISTPDDSMSVFFKPAFLTRYNRMSIKILTQLHTNSDQYVPTIKGMVLLIDMLSGQILSISDGIYITALRTGAASGLATSYLANQDASEVAIFGCGAQGRTQLEAVLVVRKIKRVFLFDSSVDQAVKLSKVIGLQNNMECEINPGLTVLKNVDIICTATPSKKPLFRLNQLKPGVHINAIGSYRTDMQELPPDIFKVSKTYLDDAAACLMESGDLTIPLRAGIIKVENIAGEIGELIAGSIPGRVNHDDITVFKSVGNAVQDFFIANEAYEKSILQDNTQVINLNA